MQTKTLQQPPYDSYSDTFHALLEVDDGEKKIYQVWHLGRDKRGPGGGIVCHLSNHKVAPDKHIGKTLIFSSRDRKLAESVYNEEESVRRARTAENKRFWRGQVQKAKTFIEAVGKI